MSNAPDRPTDAPTDDRPTDDGATVRTDRRTFCKSLGLLAAGGSRGLSDAPADAPDPTDTVLRAELKHGVVTLVLDGVREGDTIRVTFSAPGHTWSFEATADTDDSRWSFDHDRSRFVADVADKSHVEPTLWQAADIESVTVTDRRDTPRLG